MGEKLLIVGGCVAAKEAAMAARKINSECEITILSEEKYYPYYRPMLSECITGDVNEKRFYLASKEDYEKNNINLKLGEKAIEFSPDERTIKTDKGSIYSYDKLLIATGSKNFIPLPDAMDIPGVFSIKTYNDSKDAKAWVSSLKATSDLYSNLPTNDNTDVDDSNPVEASLHPSSHVIIVGGGLLGLEAAWELKSSGLDVTIIELAPRILPAQLDDESSSFFSNIITSKGVNIILNKSIKEVLNDNNINSIILNDGTSLDCDMLLFSVGIRPNIDLVKDSEIEIEHGILVNNKMETSLKNVYAAGDVTKIKDCPQGIWRPALEQGKVAGTNMAGGDITYNNPPIPIFLNSFGTQIYSIGELKSANEIDSIKSIDTHKGVYKKLYFNNDILVGGILIGDIKSSTKLSKGLENKISKEEALSLI
ncbi:MAG: NAD(P)/FAD-dependent oxidoreductase [Epulopiscium sp.]|nr:NAD(P)/FAD-dependent oxidoreductase [Candidatus Epulonipiscium sp.]